DLLLRPDLQHAVDGGVGPATAAVELEIGILDAPALAEPFGEHGLIVARIVVEEIDRTGEAVGGELDRGQSGGCRPRNSFLDVVPHEPGIAGRSLAGRRSAGDGNGVGNRIRAEAAQPPDGRRRALTAPEPAVEGVQRLEVARRGDADADLVAEG